MGYAVWDCVSFNRRLQFPWILYEKFWARHDNTFRLAIIVWSHPTATLLQLTIKKEAYIYKVNTILLSVRDIWSAFDSLKPVDN